MRDSGEKETVSSPRGSHRDCDECTWVARCAAWCWVCAHDTRVPGGGLEREPSQAELTQRFLMEMDL